MVHKVKTGLKLLKKKSIYRSVNSQNRKYKLHYNEGKKNPTLKTADSLCLFAGKPDCTNARRRDCCP